MIVAGFQYRSGRDVKPLCLIVLVDSAERSQVELSASVAPEVDEDNDDPHLTHKMDLFAFGLLLSEMLCQADSLPRDMSAALS
jgi:hypothetical protein